MGRAGTRLAVLRLYLTVPAPFLTVLIARLFPRSDEQLPAYAGWRILEGATSAVYFSSSGAVCIKYRILLLAVSLLAAATAQCVLFIKLRTGGLRPLNLASSDCDPNTGASLRQQRGPLKKQPERPTLNGRLSKQ